MLTYHPIHDPSHCIFRMLCLFEDLGEEKNHIELIRILDFFVLFPYTVASMSLPRELSDAKKIFKEIEQPYENLPTPSRLMFELSAIQDQALKSLMAKGIVDNAELSAGFFSVRKTIVPVEITKLITESTFRKAEWYKTLLGRIAKLPLKGKGGLKDRSGLMEYRYDTV